MPVKCLVCDLVFVVADDSMGQRVTCPGCGASFLAEPLAKSSLGTAEAPLSLDDAIPLPPVPVPPPVAAPKSPFRSGLKLGLVLLLTVASMTAVYVAFQYGAGEISDSAWQLFEPEDGRCRVLMPGTPEEIATADGKRFAVERRFADVRFEFGWQDVATTDFDVFARRYGEELAKRRGGTNPTMATVKFGGYDAKDITVETERGPWVERIILVPSKPRSRVFALGVGGPAVTPESGAVQKFFLSLQLRVPRE